MKTGKKILALLLVFCFMVSAVPAYAASFAHYITERPYNDLFGRWDSEATIKNVKVTVMPYNGGVGVTFDDDVMNTLLKNGELMNDYYVTLPDLTYGEGENAITVPGGKFPIKTEGGFWITTYLPTNGPVATAMVEESKTNEEFRALVKIDEATGGASLATGNSVYAGNIIAYFRYKLGIEGNPSVTTEEAILHSPSFRANGDFPLTTFILSENQITTFVGGETPVIGAYVHNNDNAKGLYAPNNSKKDLNLDGPYAVFTAPATGIYDVHVLKRDAKGADNPHQRHIVMDISGVTMNFGSSNTSSTMGYQWQNEDNRTPVSLTKGQQVVVRVLSSTGYYTGAYGFAFTPRSDAETPVTVGYNASPTAADTLNKATVKSVIPAAETANITVDGAALAVTAGAAETYYPNVRKYDATGNYISKPTLLDAVVAADKQEDIGIDAHVLTSDNYLYPLDTDTMAFSPTTAPLFGYNLPANAGDLYASIFSGAETFNLSSGTAASIDVKVPEDGTYYMIANGGHWDTGRSITVKVDGASYNDGTDTKFCFGGEGKNAHYNVQSANGIELTAGYHTLSFSVSGATRLSYVALVKADSQEAAKAIQDSFGKGEKAKFNEYFNKTERTVFDGNSIPDLLVSVNNQIIKEDWDRYIIEDGDEIGVNVFEPLAIGGVFNAVSTNITYDNNRNLSAETFANTDTIILVNGSAIPKMNIPVDLTQKDSMRGLYVNGYLVHTQDDPATSGDETQVYNYVHLPIQGNSIDSSGRLIIALKAGSNANIHFDGKVFKNINGVPVVGYQDNYKYDWSNLYITDGRFDGDATVTAQYKDGKVVIASAKAQPIFVTVKNADGTKASATNYVLNFNAPVEVAVTAGQTVYVWGGTPYIAKGTNALPLCAPVTAE